MNFKSTSFRLRLTASTLLLAGVMGVSAVGVASAAPSAPSVTATAGPVTVINAATDSAAAAAAVKLFDTATAKNFTATSAIDFIKPTDWAAPDGTSSQQNDAPLGSPNTPKILTITHALSSSWTLGGSAGVEAGAGVLGFANASVSLTITASHSWENTVSDTETINAQVEPGQMVWVLESHGQAQYTGTYTFTAANGTHYEVTNFTIIKPASKDGNPLTAATYKLVQAPIPHKAGAAAGPLSPAALTAYSRQLGYIK